jgi:dipeptide/tripeptide permease
LPVGLSLVTKIAPARILSMMMGVWLATSFIGGFLAGWLGSFWSRMEKPEFSDDRRHRRVRRRGDLRLALVLARGVARMSR